MKYLPLILLWALNANAAYFYEAHGRVGSSFTSVVSDRDGTLIYVPGPAGSVLVQVTMPDSYVPGSNFETELVGVCVQGVNYGFCLNEQFFGSMPELSGPGFAKLQFSNSYDLYVGSGILHYAVEESCANARAGELGRCLGFVFSGSVGDFRRVDEFSPYYVREPSGLAALIAAAIPGFGLSLSYRRRANRVILGGMYKNGAGTAA